MKPDLTYDHNSSLPLKIFLILSWKKNLAQFPTPSVKIKKNYLLYLLIPQDDC